MKYLITTHPSNIDAYNNMLEGLNEEVDPINRFLGSKMLSVAFKHDASVSLFSLEVKKEISEADLLKLELGISAKIGFDVKIERS